MTIAVAKMPPDTDQEAISPTQPPETANDTTTPATPSRQTKPRGITDETWRRLSPQTQRFIIGYVHDGNALTAYLAAGYVGQRHGIDNETLQRRAYSILKGKRVQAALLEYSDQRAALAQAKKDYALDWIVSEHERLMEVAEKRGDLAVATRNLELIGKTRGVYVDSAVVDVTARRELTEREEVEARHLARLRLEEMEEVQIEVGTGDHRGASMSDSAQDPAASQGGEMLPANTAPESAPGKVDTRADRTREGEHEGGA